MNKIIYISAFVLISLFSCKKQSEQENTSEKIIGKWRLEKTEYFHDDPSQNSIYTGDTVKYQYNSDGSGYYTYAITNGTNPFTWYLSANHKKITLTQSATHSYSYSISIPTDNQMILESKVPGIDFTVATVKLQLQKIE